jgi:hypothetical protein
MAANSEMYSKPGFDERIEVLRDQRWSILRARRCGEA